MSIPPPQLTWQERDEHIEAAVENYKAGAIGPISLVSQLIALRVPHAEAEKIRDEYRNENAGNRGNWNE